MGGELLATVLIVLYAIVLIALVLAILFQSARVPGFTGSFGSSSDTFLGHRRGMDETLARVTVILALLFFGLSLLLAKVVF